jgi:DNA gyrase subunit B
MAQKDYSADSIETLEFPHSVRRRADMYVGSTTGEHSPALARCLREIIDNSLDEYLIGVNKLLYIKIDTKTGEIVVVDNGRGVPTEKNTKTGKSALTLVYGELHSSGKFNRDSYSISSGKNGVGASCTNALSEYFKAWSNNNKAGTWLTQAFKRGIPDGGVTVQQPPKEFKSLIANRGTIVLYKPDNEIFKDGIGIDRRRLTAELEDIQYLCPGLHIKLVWDGEEKEYFSEKGIVELVSNKAGLNNIFEFSAQNCDVALNFTQLESFQFKSYVNLCYTDMGGKHLDGLKAAICNLFKDKSKLKIQNEDILEGVRGAIHYKMAEPQYQSQTKNELTSASARQDVIDTVQPALIKWFRKNKEIFDRILKYAEEMFEKKQKLKADKDLLKGVNKLNAAARYISDKFQDADRRKFKNPADLEMFVVEGDSAGGHFKFAREGFQAALKLRGKVINAAKKDAVKLFGSANSKDGEKGNREIRDLVAALGCGIQDNYDESELRFGKLILLTDSDVDGSHISNLILAFLIKYIPQLIKNGHVFAIDAPLFIANGTNYRSYGKTRNEVDADMKAHGVKKYTVMRAKGWGECSAEQLGEICLNPKTRKLLKIEWDDTAVEMLNKTMGTDTDFRKELLGE